MTKASGAGSIFQLKVTIKGSKPAIWRRIEIPKNATLAILHDVIQVAFGWKFAHLHEFEIAGASYGESDPDAEMFGRAVHDERKVKLTNLLQPGVRFTYTYDFGDDWEHQIAVEKLIDAEDGVGYPGCTGGGKRACPPEDCGGIWGYENLLAALNDPEHEEHDDTVEWIGDEFDPEFIDLTSTKSTLQKIR